MVWSRKLGQCPILAKKGTFFKKKGTEAFTTPYSIPFLSVLHQNKGLHNFHKKSRLGPDWVWKKVNFFKAFWLFSFIVSYFENNILHAMAVLGYFPKLKRDHGLVFSAHVLHDFLIKMFLV